MKNMKNLSKRALVLLLVLSMCMGMLPTTAFAAEAEHTHTEDGWTCTQETTRELTCKAHVHGEDCYETKQGELTCEADEHTHDDGCYAVETTLDCTEAEHTHGDGCYEEDELTCEAGEHSHGDSCYVTETVTVCTDAEHTHGDGCYETVTELACTEDGHEHDDGCYTVTEGKWTCVAPETPKADADDADEADETDEADEADEAALPAEVEAFLAAVDALPAADTVTPDNVIWVGMQLMADELVDGADAAKNYLGVPEVAAAYAKYTELFTAVKALMGLGNELYIDADLNSGWKNQDMQGWLNGQSGSNVTLNMSSDYWLNQTLIIPANTTVTIKGNGKTIWRGTWWQDGKKYICDCAMFTVKGTLILENVTVNGLDEEVDSKSTKAYDAWKVNDFWSNSSLISVENGGTLTLNSGATLKESHTSVDGGGVYVHDGATLNVNSGSEIMNCNAKLGGGVYVENGGTLNANGGGIGTNSCDSKDNKASHRVYAELNATLNGQISRNDDGVFQEVPKLPDEFQQGTKVYLTINGRAFDGLPGEPSALDRGEYIWVIPDEYVYWFQKGSEKEITEDPSRILDVSILSSPDYKRATTGNTRGVSDPTGVKTKQFIGDRVNWDKLLEQLTYATKDNGFDYGIQVVGPTTESKYYINECPGFGGETLIGRNEVKANYMVIPYVIKYQDTISPGWHIDCAVVPKDRIQVDYILNLPNGVTTDKAFGVPEGVVGVGKELFVVSLGLLKYGGNTVTTETTIPATYKGYGVNLKFLGWASSPESKTWYSLTAAYTFDKNTQLYAQWQIEEPAYTVQWLVAGKDGAEDTVLKSETRYPTFDELQTGTVSTKKADEVFEPDNGEITYQFDAENTKNVTSATLVTDGNTELKLYFKVPTADYTVQWLTKDKDGNDVPPLKTATRTGNVGATVSVTEDDKAFKSEDGKITYQFDAGNTENVTSATLDESGTMLKLYFTVPASQLKDLQARYLVQWIDGETVVKSEVRGPEAMGTEVKVTDADKKDFTEGGKNYTLDQTADHVEKGTLKAIAGPGDIVTLKLYFVAQYTVTYVANGGTLATGVAATSKVNDGTEITVAAKATTSESKHFTGWLGNDGKTYQPEDTITVTSDITLTAQWAEHSYGEWETTKEPDCLNKGEKERTCTGCDHVETEEIDALDHDWNDNKWHDNGDGTHSQVCKRDETHVNTEKVNHTYGAWNTTLEPTCTKPGVKEQSCTVCGHKETDTVDAKGHTFPESWTDGCANHADAACENHTKTCTVCNGAETEPGGIQTAIHTYSDDNWTVNKAATATETGEQQRTCTAIGCGHIQKEEIPALGQVTITVKFVDEENQEIGSGERQIVTKGESYNVTALTERIPAGYKRDGKITGDPVEGTANDNKTVIVPVKKIVYAIAADDVEAVYDGKAHPVTNVTLTADGVPVDAAGYTLEIAYELTKARSAIEGAPVDAGAYTATITATVEGKKVSAQAEVTITPAKLTVTTESASKTYDRKALTAGGKVEGLVEGETVTFEVTGSQTQVGSSDNTYTLTWDGTADENNYTVVENLGTLTVKERTSTGGGNGGGNEPDPKPDPKPDPDPVDPTPVDPEDPTVDIDDPDVPLAEDPTVDIDEPDVPLAELPGADDSLVEIPDLEVPLADVPKTGDLSIFWYMTTLLSAMGLMVLAVLERRQRREK